MPGRLQRGLIVLLVLGGVFVWGPPARITLCNASWSCLAESMATAAATDGCCPPAPEAPAPVLCDCCFDVQVGLGIDAEPRDEDGLAGATLALVPAAVEPDDAPPPADGAPTRIGGPQLAHAPPERVLPLLI